MTRKSEKRVRRPDHGDFEEGSSIALAVDRFRTMAQLHLSSPDDALVRYAHVDGYDCPGAALVRSTFVASGMMLPEVPVGTPGDCQIESFVVEQIVRSPVLEDVDEFSVTERLGYRRVASEDDDEDESILY